MFPFQAETSQGALGTLANVVTSLANLSESLNNGDTSEVQQEEQSASEITRYAFIFTPYLVICVLCGVSLHSFIKGICHCCIRHSIDFQIAPTLKQNTSSLEISFGPCPLVKNCVLCYKCSVLKLDQIWFSEKLTITRLWPWKTLRIATFWCHFISQMYFM